MEFKPYDFNPVLDLSNVPHREIRNAGWEFCDNFIEGLEWEDIRQKPKTDEEKREGLPPRGMSGNRGWRKYRCKAYKGKERFLRWKGGKEVTDNNPKGIIDSASWLRCSHCAEYSPRTLEGRRDVLIKVKEQYERELDNFRQRIEKLDRELAKQSGDPQGPT